MNAAEQFFYGNAGWSYDSAIETSDEGRIRCAVALAHAEATLLAGPYWIEVKPDPFPWDGDTPYDGPLWSVFLWSCADTTEPYLVGSLHSVACERYDAYIRVVSAELVSEELS